MQKQLDLFLKLSEIFKKNGYILYLVGGTVRDFLMEIPLDDMDAVTDATPDQMKVILSEYKTDFTFAKYGSIKLFIDGCKFDVTTLRKEEAYFDGRHPNDIEFVKETEIDVRRRDFTVNAMYLNNRFEVIDFVGGQEDLKNKILRMVGDPDNRLQEDPLRIVRALRFCITYNFQLDEVLKESIIRNSKLIKKLNPEKIKLDLRKLKNLDRCAFEKMCTELCINEIIDMID